MIRYTLACLLLSLTSVLHAAERPNIIVVLVDDMGWSDIGCYGSEIPTPNIDRLAAEGVRFTQHYNTGRCSPTRASLMTGHYPHQAGMGHLDNIRSPDHPGFEGKLNNRSVTIAEVLGDAGYLTCMTGKWHMGQQHGTTPWNRGFARSLNLRAGGIHFYNQNNGQATQQLFLNGKGFDVDDPQFGQWYGSYLWADYGLKFIDEAREADQPFFLYLAHCAAHFPLMAPEEVIAKYRGKYLVGWDKLRQARYEKQIELGVIKPEWKLTDREATSPAWDSLSADEQERFDDMMAIYAAMIETIDTSMGTIVDGLRERGELDNTLILFMSDNGGNAESGPNGRYEGEHPGGPDSTVFVGQNWATLNNTPFRKWKHYVHEGGCSTPLIAHWPAGIDKTRNGSLYHEPTHLIDVMATAVDVTAATYPSERDGNFIEPMEGVSLAPAFAGETLARPQPIFFNHENNRAVRDGKWKLVALANQPWELYDMEADRTELHNLAGEHPDIVATMKQQYQDWAIRTRVNVPGTTPGWPPRNAQQQRPNRRNRQAAEATS